MENIKDKLNHLIDLCDQVLYGNMLEKDMKSFVEGQKLGYVNALRLIVEEEEDE